MRLRTCFKLKKRSREQLSLNDKLVGSSIQVGLNDRIAFVNKLFNFSQSDFNKALTKLNGFGSKKGGLELFPIPGKTQLQLEGQGRA